MRKFLICCWFTASMFSTLQLLAINNPQFPLKISKNKKYLTDQRGLPFLMNADTGWLLLQKLSTDDIKIYFSKRKSQTFNTVLIQLLPPLPTGQNFYGQPPFSIPNDFSTPNEVYFNHVAAVLAEAQKFDILVAINPVWLGDISGGWANVQVQNGDSVCNAYGQFLGERFKKFDNVLWIMGGDSDAPHDQNVIRVMANGIKSSADHQLITYLGARFNPNNDVIKQVPWLDFRTTQAQFNLPQMSEMSQTSYHNPKAFVVCKTKYESTETAQSTRQYAYQAMLTGGSGQCYVSKNWKFDKNWLSICDLPGAQQMKLFYKFMVHLPWEHFVPDTQKQFIPDSPAADQILAASLSNRRLMVAYIPESRPLQIDFSKFKGNRLRVSWLSPRTGKKWVTAHHAPKDGIRQVKPPTVDEDWLLVIGNVAKD